MGTWSAGSFGNDAAADWVHDLADTLDTELVEQTLRGVADFPETDMLDAWDAAEAVAAADVVAAAGGRPWPPDAVVGPRPGIEDEALAWAEQHPEAADHALLALVALLRVTDEESELRQLWLETGGAPADGEDHEWLTAVAGLRARLASSPPG